MRLKLTNILYCFSFALILLAAIPSLAQATKPTVVRGQIIEAGSKLPIPGATVVEQDAENRTVNGVITDIDGNFALRIKNPNHKLFISSIGFNSKSIPINGKETINVSLVSSVETLNEIVIKSGKTVESGLLNVAERNRPPVL
jgi:hypothetical protein